MAFFGFFGALKKGRLFWGPTKKSPAHQKQPPHFFRRIFLKSFRSIGLRREKRRFSFGDFGPACYTRASNARAEQKSNIPAARRHLRVTKAWSPGPRPNAFALLPPAKAVRSPIRRVNRTRMNAATRGDRENWSAPWRTQESNFWELRGPVSIRTDSSPTNRFKGRFSPTPKSLIRQGRSRCARSIKRRCPKDRRGIFHRITHLRRKTVLILMEMTRAAAAP